MIQKLFLLITVVAAVWFGVKAYNRFELARQRREKRESREAREGTLVAQEMVKCARCGTYVAGPHPRRCARADCPYAQ